MNYKQVLYSDLIQTLTDYNAEINKKIDELEEQEEQEEHEYPASLEGKEQSELEESYEELSEFINTIEDALVNSNGIPCLNNIYANIQQIPVYDSTDTFWNKISILFKIGKRIESNISIEDLDNEITLNVDEFKVSKHIKNDLPFNEFAYFNTTNNLDSLAYLDLENSNLDNFDGNGFNIALLTTFLKKISNINDNEIPSGFILHRQDAINLNFIESSMKMLAVLKGNIIHEPMKSNITPNLNSYFDDISCLHSFSQFNESLVILSEMNERDDILGKYLSIYHVIESFMHKVPLVHLSKRTSGNIFKIRDFKNLYEKIDNGERDQIKKLFHKPYTGLRYWDVQLETEKFYELIARKLTEFENIPDFDITVCNDFFADIGITDRNGYDKNGYYKFKQNPTANAYADLVYSVRCAIVHNKETEHHISHFNLCNNIAKFIDLVLIEPLSTLIARLFTDKQTNIWYDGQNLSLYA